MDFETYKKLPQLNGSTLVHGIHSMRRLKRALDGKYPEPTDALRTGSGVHALLLEPIDFEDLYCVVPDFHLDPNNLRAARNKSETDEQRRTDSRATKYYQDRMKEFASANCAKTFLSRKEYDDALYALESLRSRPMVCSYLQDAQCEQTLIGELDGVPVKGRLDIIRTGFVVDLKSTRDASPRWFGRDFANFHYGPKLAIYQELARQNGLGACEVKVIAQELAGDFDTVIYNVTQAVLDAGLAKIRKVIADYRECMRTGVWPGVDRGKDELELYVPNWAMENAGDELVEWSE